jgi:mRNA-degrading endonuclease YafQ of YafQ-DinJ toxin-antitoxin module
MRIYLTSKFKKAYKRLPGKIKNKATKREKVFRENPFHPTLKTHSLHGKYKEFWAFSIDNSYRIMFKFLNTAKTEAVFINIGVHNIYK